MSKNIFSTDVILGVTLILLSIIGLFIVIPAGVDMPSDIKVKALAPNFWPTIVVAVIGVLGAVITLEGWAAGKNAEASSSSDESNSASVGMETGRFLIVIFILAAIYFLIPYIGMVAATIISMFILTVFGGERRIAMIIGLGVGLPVLLYVFFVYVANVPLPVGVFFESL